VVQRRLERALLGTVFVIFVLASIPDTAVVRADPLRVVVSTEVTGLCDSPPWDKVTFYANVSGGVPPNTYVWDFGDGSAPSTSATPTHHYGLWLRFTANVTVTDSAGAQATGSASVDILQPPCPLRREPLLGMPPLGETDLGFLIGGVVVLFVIGLVVYRRRIRR